MEETVLQTTAKQLSEFLLEKKWMIATAESCTGGWIAKTLTDLAGSSRYFDRGIVTYSNAAKMKMLGVTAETLEQHGAVSEETVAEMASGMLQRSQAQVAVAVSGIAGPSGGSVEKPVGMVCFGWAFKNGQIVTKTRCFDGDRDQIRMQTVQFALSEIQSLVKEF